jgi:hypothetical protein
MKTSTLFILTLASLLLIIGCSPQIRFLQLAEVGSTNCRINENYLFSENDTLRVVYMFWGENGVVDIFIHNKTEYPLYIDWKKCSFITGITKHDYWGENTIITTSHNSSLYGEAKMRKNSSEWFQQTFTNSLTRITKPERITFIPPHTTISQGAYNIVFGGITISSSFPTSIEDTILYFQSKKFQQQKITAIFNVSNSPVNFRSFITYSTDEKFSTEHYLDSKFYVSRISDLPKSAFDGKPDSFSVDQSKYNMWASPSSFYIFTKEGLQANELLKSEELIIKETKEGYIGLPSQLTDPSDQQYLYGMGKRRMVRIYVNNVMSEIYLVGETSLKYLYISNERDRDSIRYIRKTIIQKIEDKNAIPK